MRIVDPMEEMYLLYKNMIFQYLYQLSGNYHTAQELTHDTFLKAFKSFKNFRGDSSIKTWLYSIARNTYLNDIRKNTTKHEYSVDAAVADTFFIDNKDSYSNITEKLIIQDVLLALNEKYRTLILLREKGLTYQEISEIIGETVGQVKVTLYRARKKFKEIYQRKEKGEI